MPAYPSARMFSWGIKLQLATTARSRTTSVYDNVILKKVSSVAQVWCLRMCITPISGERKSEYQDTLVKRGATLGANCTIVCGVTVGQFAFIGAGAVVNKDVPDYALMAGVPARQIGWMSEYGERLDVPLQGDAETRCRHTGTIYRLHEQVLVRVN